MDLPSSCKVPKKSEVNVKQLQNQLLWYILESLYVYFYNGNLATTPKDYLYGNLDCSTND